MMMNTVDLQTVCICNLVGILLVIVLFFGNYWRLSFKTDENHYILSLMAVTFCSCILDPLVFLADGHPGTGPYLLILLGNFWLYMANMLAAFSWIRFLCDHLHVGNTRGHNILIHIPLIIGTITLIINLFVPIAYQVGEGNIYSRRPLYFLYLAIAAFYLADSLAIYILGRRKGGVLKIFPVWLFIFPVVVGAVLQSVTYGISVLWPCFAISTAGIMGALQNESVYRDKLTGLYNRTYLDYLQDLMLRRRNAPVTGIMADLNGFKTINDTYGHAIGDEALVIASNLLRNAVGSRGNVIRYAGDEFVILVNSVDEKKAEECMTDIRAALENYNDNGGKPYHLSVSMGSCVFDAKTQTITDFMNHIDHAMYEDKRAFYAANARFNRRRSNGVHSKSDQLVLEGLLQGLEQHQFNVWYQPQFSLSTGELTGSEALIRWFHPTLGLQSPANFIPVFESLGLISRLDIYVFEEVCRFLRICLDEGKPVVPVSFNLSRQDIADPQHIPTLEALRIRYNIPVNLLRAELTETSAALSNAETRAALDQLHSLGYIVEMDDFGSGISSLNVLKDMPFDIVKMDISFISGKVGSRGGTIIGSVIRMCRDLKTPVIAEGVENQEQADYMRRIGCDMVQGYFYSRPLPEDQYLSLVAEKIAG